MYYVRLLLLLAMLLLAVAAVAVGRAGGRYNNCADHNTNCDNFTNKMIV